MKLTNKRLKEIIKEELEEATERWDPEAPSRPGGPEDPALRPRKELDAMEAYVGQLLNLMSLIDKDELRSIRGGDEILMVVKKISDVWFDQVR